MTGVFVGYFFALDSFLPGLIFSVGVTSGSGGSANGI